MEQEADQVLTDYSVLTGGLPYKPDTLKRLIAAALRAARADALEEAAEIAERAAERLCAVAVDIRSLGEK